jgi:hydroxymethylglutaryl-CoA lyase
MYKNLPLKIIECPRDAMQGWPHHITTQNKVKYINSLLQVGFDTIDFGSFVSPKAIPQMADTAIVLKQLNLTNTLSKLLAIVANERGANEAVEFDEITYLGFPFSISETFQIRNTNSTIDSSLERVSAIQNLCLQKNKQLVVYISMAFGNPYGDLYNEEIVFNWSNKMAQLGVKIISLADTVGVATATQIQHVTQHVIKQLPQIEVGVHLHTTALNWKQKVQAAVDAGCSRFDGALKGIGGCPMANDELIGNMNTENLIDFFSETETPFAHHADALKKCNLLATEIFGI